MRIVAFNGSPRGPRSNTDRLLLPFLEGAQEAGATTEVVYLKEQRIEYCQGCFNCWVVTPGVCIHDDDMAALLDKIRAADVIVYATPLYVFTMSAQMKTFLDRHIPLAAPFIVKRGDQYIHPMRHPEAWPKKVVLISNCGFPERHHFSGLLETFRVYTSSPDLELAGAILCTAGELLGQKSASKWVNWYIEATRQAGREVVEVGHITLETQQVLEKPLVKAALYSRMANMYFKRTIKKQR